MILGGSAARSGDLAVRNRRLRVRRRGIVLFMVGDIHDSLPGIAVSKECSNLPPLSRHVGKG
tara:strand:- start:1399 stop:1584 length:186 start_codon:yes stop_codon:yes gene_type:complete